MPTLQIADKPTLDKVLDLLSHKGIYVGKEVCENKPLELPYEFYNGCAVVYNDEIHILGSSCSSPNNKRCHFKFDGNDWKVASVLPYEFSSGSAVVYNDKIHILGGSDSPKKHAVWNGESWTELANLPYSFYNGDAVVWNRYIHIFGSSVTDSSNNRVGAKNHYFYNDYENFQSNK